MLIKHFQILFLGTYTLWKACLSKSNEIDFVKKIIRPCLCFALAVIQSCHNLSKKINAGKKELKKNNKVQQEECAKGEQAANSQENT